jgi:hypothetical protein
LLKTSGSFNNIARRSEQILPFSLLMNKHCAIHLLLSQNKMDPTHYLSKKKNGSNIQHMMQHAQIHQRFHLTFKPIDQVNFQTQ